MRFKLNPPFRPTFRRPAMVLHFPRNVSACVGPLETIGSDKILQPPDLGQVPYQIGRTAGSRGSPNAANRTISGKCVTGFGSRKRFVSPTRFPEADLPLDRLNRRPGRQSDV